MSTVTIEWTARAAGRHPGDRETVELSTFINGVVSNGYAKILIEHQPIVGFQPAPYDPVLDKPVYEDAGSVLATTKAMIADDQPTGDRPSQAS